MLRLLPLILIVLAAPVLATEPTATPVDSAPAASAAADAPSAKARRGKTECGQTGSRIKRGTGSQPMRCYSRQDLEKTGATDLGAGLRRLDPSLR